jgi:hypothetical protein
MPVLGRHMNKSALALAGVGFAAGIVLFLVVEPLLPSAPNVTPAPQLAAVVAQPTPPHAKALPPSEPAPEVREGPSTMRSLGGSEAAKSSTLFQYTKWGMSPEELLAFGKGNIVKASPREASPNVTEFQGKRGTTMAVDADLVLTSGFSAEGMTYNALYYFNASGLFLIAPIPKSIDDGFKTSKLLDATYGASDREERMGLNENYSGCIARRRWRVPRDGNLVTFFNLCGTRFEVRYEPIPRGGL